MKKLLILTTLVGTSVAPVVACGKSSNKEDAYALLSSWKSPSGLGIHMNDHALLSSALSNFAEEVTKFDGDYSEKNTTSTLLASIMRSRLTSSFPDFPSKSVISSISPGSNYAPIETGTNGGTEVKTLRFILAIGKDSTRSITISWRVYVDEMSLLQSWKAPQMSQVDIDTHNKFVDDLSTSIVSLSPTPNQLQVRVNELLRRLIFSDLASFPVNSQVEIEQIDIPAKIVAGSLNALNKVSNFKFDLVYNSVRRNVNLNWEIFNSVEDVVLNWQVPNPTIVNATDNDRAIEKLKLLGTTEIDAINLYNVLKENLFQNIRQFPSNSYATIKNASEIANGITAGERTLIFELQIRRENGQESSVRLIEITWNVVVNDADVFIGLQDQTISLSIQDYNEFASTYAEIKSRVTPSISYEDANITDALEIDKSRDLITLINAYFPTRLNLPLNTRAFGWESGLPLTSVAGTKSFSVQWQVNNAAHRALTYTINYGDQGSIFNWVDPSQSSMSIRKHNELVAKINGFLNPRPNQIIDLMKTVFGNLPQAPDAYRIDSSGIPNTLQNSQIPVNQSMFITYWVRIVSNSESRMLTFKWSVSADPYEKLQVWSKPELPRITSANHNQFVSEITTIVSSLSGANGSEVAFSTLSSSDIGIRKQKAADLSEVFTKYFNDANSFDRNAILLTKVEVKNHAFNLQTAKVRVHSLTFALASAENYQNSAADNYKLSYTLTWESFNSANDTELANDIYVPPQKVIISADNHNKAANLLNQIADASPDALTSVQKVLMQHVFANMPPLPKGFILVTKTGLPTNVTANGKNYQFSIKIQTPNGRRGDYRFIWQVSTVSNVAYSFSNQINGAIISYQTFSDLKATLARIWPTQVLDLDGGKTTEFIEFFKTKVMPNLSLPAGIQIGGYIKGNEFDTAETTEPKNIRLRLRLIDSLTNLEIQPANNSLNFEFELRVRTQASITTELLSDYTTTQAALITYGNYNNFIAEMLRIRRLYNNNSTAATMRVLTALKTYINKSFGTIAPDIWLVDTGNISTSTIAWSPEDNYAESSLDFKFAVNGLNPTASNTSYKFKIFNDFDDEVEIPDAKTIPLQVHKEVLGNLKVIHSSNDTPRIKFEKIMTVLSDKVYRQTLNYHSSATYHGMMDLDSVVITSNRFFKLDLSIQIKTTTSIEGNDLVLPTMLSYIWSVEGSEEEFSREWSVSQPDVQLTSTQYDTLINALKPLQSGNITQSQSDTAINLINDSLGAKVMNNFIAFGLKIVRFESLVNFSTTTSYTIPFRYQSKTNQYISLATISVQVNSPSSTVDTLATKINSLSSVTDPFKVSSVMRANKLFSDLNAATTSAQIWKILSGLPGDNFGHDSSITITKDGTNSYTNFALVDGNKNLNSNLNRTLKFNIAAGGNTKSISININATIADFEILSLIKVDMSTAPVISLVKLYELIDLLRGRVPGGLDEVIKFMRGSEVLNEASTANPSAPHDPSEPRNSNFGPFYSLSNGYVKNKPYLIYSNSPIISQPSSYDNVGKDVTFAVVVGIGFAKISIPVTMKAKISSIQQSYNLAWYQSGIVRFARDISAFETEALRLNAEVDAGGLTHDDHVRIGVTLRKLMNRYLWASYSLQDILDRRATFKKVDIIHTDFGTPTQGTVIKVVFDIIGGQGEREIEYSYNLGTNISQDPLSTWLSTYQPTSEMPIHYLDWQKFKSAETHSGNIRSQMTKYFGGLYETISTAFNLSRIEFSSNPLNANNESSQYFLVYATGLNTAPLRFNVKTVNVTEDQAPEVYNFFAPGVESKLISSGDVADWMGIYHTAMVYEDPSDNMAGTKTNDFDSTVWLLRMFDRMTSGSAITFHLKNMNAFIRKMKYARTTNKLDIEFELVTKKTDGTEYVQEIVWNWRTDGPRDDIPSTALNLGPSNSLKLYTITRKEYNVLANYTNTLIDKTAESADGFLKNDYTFHNVYVRYFAIIRESVIRMFGRGGMVKLETSTKLQILDSNAETPSNEITIRMKAAQSKTGYNRSYGFRLRVVEDI